MRAALDLTINLVVSWVALATHTVFFSLMPTLTVGAG